MESKIIDLAHQIKNHNHCNGCGGVYGADACCKYCGGKSDAIEYLLFQLNSELKKIDQRKFQVGAIDPLLNSLYFIRDIEDAEVNELLNKVSYQSTVLKENNKLHSPTDINSLSSLTPEEFDFVYYSFMFDEVVGPEKLLYSSYIVKDIVENKCKNLNSTEKKQFFIKFASTVAEQALNNRHVTVTITDELDEKVKGDFGGKNFGKFIFADVRLNSQLFEEEKDVSLIFPTIFHELAHLKQEQQMYLSHEISEKCLLQLKDYVLSHVVDGYYDKNYPLLSTEKEAFYGGNKDAKDYLNNLGLPVPDEILKAHDYFASLSFDKTRIMNDEPVDIDDLFADEIKKNPDILEKFPQLSFEYIKENGVVRPKTVDEIKSDYELVKQGKLEWKVETGTDINQMYDSRISMLEQKNK